MHPRYGILSCALLLVASVASAWEFGPPDGYAGNPILYQNCSVCHYSYEPDSGDGALQLIGLPASYVPGQTYSLSVELSDPGQRRWGFELCAVNDADPDNPYADGGALLVTDATNTQLSVDGDGTLDYLKQTEDGAYTGVPNGPITWSFQWKAPNDPGIPSVSFYVAGNAADNDDSYIGDYIYTRAVTVYPENPTATAETTWGRVKELYRRR